MGKFLTPIDLVQNELQNCRLQNLASAPGTPVEGQIYYDTVSDKVKWWNGAAWVDATGGAGTVTAVTASAPIVSSGGTTPNLTLNDLVDADIAGAAAIAYSKLALTGAILNADLAGSIAYSKLSLTGAILNADLAGSIAYAKLTLTNSIVNADIASAAGIAYSKLNLATSIVNGDIGAAAAIVYSKLSLGNSIVNADIAAGAAIAYSKLALTGAILNADLAGSIAYSKLSLGNSIVNADIAAGAAIAYSKLNLAGAILNADLAGSIAYSKLSAPVGTVSMGSQLVSNVLNPVSAQDAATKAYVDSMSQGLDVKASVRGVSVAPIALVGELTTAVTGITLNSGDRVLVTAQAAGANNGIYAASAGAWTRTTDADASADVTAGMYVFVEEGTTYADTGWILTTNNPITLGTTPLVFTQFSGAGQITAGAGLTKTGDTLNVIGTTNRILVSADSIDIDPTNYVGQTSITTLGTVTVGTWNATTIAVAKGGTGGTTAAAAKTGLGFMTRYATTVGDGAALAYVLTHNLNTRDVVVDVYRATTPWDQVHCDVEATSVNTVTLRFAVAPTSAQYNAVVIG